MEDKGEDVVVAAAAEADELAEAELIGTASVLVNASPVTPITVCAIPAWREKVPSPVPQSHVPAAALGWQHQFWFPQDTTVPSLALTGSSKCGVSPCMRNATEFFGMLVRYVLRQKLPQAVEFH